MPFCVDVELLGDPETVATFIACSVRVVLRIDQEAVVIVCVRHIDSFVIRRRDVGLVNDIRLAVEYLREFRVKIPAVKRVARQVPTGRFADVTAFADTEIHRLIRSTPVDISACTFRIIDMQENTVLLLAPFRIDRYAALGHLVEGVLLRAGTIDVPALENVTGWGLSFIRCVRVVRRDIGAVGNITFCAYLAYTSFFHRIAVAINVYAIHKIDRINVTCVIAIDINGRVVAPNRILSLSICIICLGWICITSF